MPTPKEFKTVKDATKLKAIPFAVDDMTVLGWGEESNRGTDMHGPEDADQLNVRWDEGGKWTYVQPIGQRNKVLPFKFHGHIAVDDVMAWYHADRGFGETAVIEDTAEVDEDKAQVDNAKA